jgi:BlaI family transcriptional regulator, penicillinase repressor
MSVATCGRLSMTRKRRDVTEAEMAILQALWDDRWATIRQLTETVYPGWAASEYATVKKLIERLEKKGYVVRDSREATHRFNASITRDDLLGQRLDSLAEELCSGSRTPILMNLFHGRKLTESERKELRRFLGDLIGKQSKR